MFLCFVVIVRVRAIALNSLFYVTDEGYAGVNVNPHPPPRDKVTPALHVLTPRMSHFVDERSTTFSEDF